MSGNDPRINLTGAWRAIDAATLRAEGAEQAAAHAAAAAQRQERIAARGGMAADMHARMAAAHRGSERRQREAARLQRGYARMLTSWALLADEGATASPRPVLMRAVTDRAGWRGSVLTLCTAAGVEELVAASDSQARRAHELEVSVGEGPSFDAMHGRSSLAAGLELRRRWPQYGHEVAELGVQAVASVPVEIGSGMLGSLTVTGAAVPIGWVTEHLAELSVVLGEVLVTRDTVNLDTVAMDTVDLDLNLPGLNQFEDEDHQPELQQAAGVLHERSGLAIDDAVALIRAHAYAEDRSVADVALDVVRGGVLEP